MNLFWSTRRLTESREDHLTEFFAAALAHVPPFRESYTERLISAFARRLGWPPPVIERVETQAEFPGCLPDMLLHLRGGRVVACEHKLEALETLGADDDRGQLERYLDLPVDGVAYVRRAWMAPSAKVLSHPKYIRPPEREHFLWSDFFPLLGPGQHLLVDWLREGFELLGYTPPNPNVGELTLRPSAETRRSMEDFAKLWGRVKTSAVRLGWTVQGGSTIQLYLVRHSSSSVAQIFVSPESQGEFLVRFTPLDPGRLEEVRSAVAPTAAALPHEPRVKIAKGSWQGAKVNVVDVRATRHAVLGLDETTVEELELRLLTFVEPLVRAVSGASGGSAP